jgi:hypothetical protein
LSNLPPAWSTVITTSAALTPALVHADGDAAAVVLDRHRAVEVDGDVDLVQ